MLMNIKFYREITEENALEVYQDILQLSLLMEDADEKEYAVFTTISILLKDGNGCLFNVTNNDGQKIGYGAFSYGAQIKTLRRLYYFAIEPEFRALGLGLESLKKAIKLEVSLDSGCSVACNPYLKPFYEQLGFVYCEKMKGSSGKDEIVMSLSSLDGDKGCSILDNEISLISIDSNLAKYNAKNMRNSINKLLENT